MSNHKIQISSNISVEFTSSTSLSHSDYTRVGVAALLNYLGSTNNVGNVHLNIAQKIYNVHYRVIVNRIIERAMLYNDAIIFLRSRRGIDLDPQLVDYAVDRLYELLDRR
jgi:hypothetical protein